MANSTPRWFGIPRNATSPEMAFNERIWISSPGPTSTVPNEPSPRWSSTVATSSGAGAAVVAAGAAVVAAAAGAAVVAAAAGAAVVAAGAAAPPPPSEPQAPASSVNVASSAVNQRSRVLMKTGSPRVECDHRREVTRVTLPKKLDHIRGDSICSSRASRTSPPRNDRQPIRRTDPLPTNRAHPAGSGS